MQSKYPLLDRSTVAAMLPEIDARAVSLAARGRIPAATPQGFTQVFFDGSLDDAATLRQTYRERRESFIKRHAATRAALWDADGRPTRKHLALIAWAYSPDVPRLRYYIQKNKLKNRQYSKYLGL